MTGQNFVTVTGAIDGFGSVIINGTRYDTDTAEVKNDGETAALSDLSVGKVVSLRARRNGEGELPTALRVRYEEVLEGPVETIASDLSSLNILGQTVYLTKSTVYDDDLDPANIRVDDVLEISGSFTANGDIVASYVELSDDLDNDFEIHGTVGNLNETDQTFRLRGLVIGYGSAELEDFEDGNVLSNGDKVEVEGSIFLNDGTFVATNVEYEGDDLDELAGDDVDDDDQEDIEIEGFITAYTSPENFEVNGQAVTTNSDTEFEDCSVSDLALDVEVEVEGELDENGILVADEIDCESEANVFITALVDAVNETNNTVTLLGVSLSVDMRTSFLDKDDSRVREFGLDDISVGDVLEVQAFQSAQSESGALIAKRIRRERDEGFEGPEIEGGVTNIGEDMFSVAGVIVNLTNETEFELDDDEVSKEAFLDAISLGDRLEVEGREDADGNFFATEVELESESDDEDENDD